MESKPETTIKLLTDKKWCESHQHVNRQESIRVLCGCLEVERESGSGYRKRTKLKLGDDKIWIQHFYNHRIRARKIPTVVVTVLYPSYFYNPETDK